MSKVKQRDIVNKINKPSVSRGGECPQTPAFSFIYMTANHRYTIDGISDQNNRRTASEYILKRLIEIGKASWLYWHSRGKIHGLETIPSSSINFKPSDKKLTPDEKVYVFRVKSYAGDDARILGIREDGCPIMHIIGFDFDYSAYDHG